MATAAAQRRDVKEYTYVWEGIDRNNRQVRGESKAASQTVVTTNLRRQGIRVQKIKRLTFRGGKKVGEREITFFTRQLATMLRAGVPLLQAFEIVARGHGNPRFSRLVMDLKSRVEAGSSLSQASASTGAVRQSYCNLVHAGRLPACWTASWIGSRRTGKDPCDQEQDQVGAVLPISVIVVAILVIWVIMVWVIPAFKQIFQSFGADLPLPTLIVMAMSDFVVSFWWVGFLFVVGAIVAFGYLHRRSAAFRFALDRLSLRIPVVGQILEKATIARWTRTLQTMFAAAYWSSRSTPSARVATRCSPRRPRESDRVSTGTSLTNAMTNSKLFPNMVLQMTQIGEESGSLDNMLGKIAEFYERRSTTPLRRCRACSSRSSSCSSASSSGSRGGDVPADLQVGPGCLRPCGSGVPAGFCAPESRRGSPPWRAHAT
jgi:type IV pilus assembly protein PilC